MAELTLRERKQQRAHDQIVDAAYALFAERGFAAVTVADIAERAEVGRTTFFRYFGDKQEVLFADEQPLLDRLAERHAPAPGAAPPADLRAALAELRAVAVELCAEIGAGDRRRYAERDRLIAASPELQDRNHRKLQRVTEAAEALLLARGAAPDLAALAAEVAVACLRAGLRAAGTDPLALTPAVGRAFDHIDGLADRRADRAAATG